MTRITVLAALALTAALFAVETSAGTQPAQRIDVRLQLTRFELTEGRRLVAHGQLVARYRDGIFVKATAARPTTMTVRRGQSCRRLHLEGGPLAVELSGLRVDLTPADHREIVLDLDAAPPGALGELFCRVASGTAAQRAQAAGPLTAAMRRQLVVEISVPLASDLPAPRMLQECPVLNVVLGPLSLQLVGVRVQLSEVELDVTATPSGALGPRYCG